MQSQTQQQVIATASGMSARIRSVNGRAPCAPDSSQPAPQEACTLRDANGATISPTAILCDTP
jgi:hypothetical protein